MQLPEIFLRKNEDIRIRNGHLWVFSNEIFKTVGNPENGDLVDVVDSRNNLIGSGFYNKNSLISVRILAHTHIEDLHSVLREKILRAASLRKDIYPQRISYRLAFSESDFLPGLIIDKYNNTFVLQVYSYGIEKNVNSIVQILKNDLSAENIFSRNEEYFRQLEGLPIEDTVFLGKKKPEVISDGRINYRIEFDKSHKTGFYFDQSDNRFFIERICHGKTFLDAFCNSGGFGLHAAKARASSVVFVDSSHNEIDNAKNNFELNQLSIEAGFIQMDVLDAFTKFINEKRKFDIVNIDPPAFAKNKKTLPAARKGYEKLNRLAFELVADGGYLITSSCSFHLKIDEFIQIVNTAALKAGKNISLIYFNEASMDHPSLPVMPETSYLKFAVVRVF